MFVIIGRFLDHKIFNFSDSFQRRVCGGVIGNYICSGLGASVVSIYYVGGPVKLGATVIGQVYLTCECSAEFNSDQRDIVLIICHG